MQPATRILYLDYTNNIGLGGGQRSLSLLVRYLDRRRYEPVVAVPAGERVLELIGADVARFELPLPEAFRSISRDGARGLRLARAAGSVWPAVRAVRSIANQAHARVIHANNLKMLFLAAAARPDLPRLWHVRDIFPDTPMVRRILALASRLSTRVISVSRAVAAHLPPGARNEVLYNAVDLPEPDSRAASKRGPVTVGFVGRLDRWKGIPVLLEAFRAARRDHPQARLLVVGDGPEASLVGGEGVERLPFQRDLGAVWPRIDIAVVPSTEPDPFPRSVIEAMSWGKPVVGSATGGIPEAIAHGETGLLFAPGSVSQLRDSLVRLLSSPADTAAMGACGRLRCEQMFSTKAQAEKMGRIYGDVLRDAAAAPEREE
jgi:glycosyltransferase involved in cell wall biosynthesis